VPCRRRFDLRIREKELEIKVPKGLSLRPYQEVGVRHLLSGKRKLLLDDMGLGKTAQTIVAFNSLGAKRVLIVCPPAVVNSWREETERWSVRQYKIHIVTKRLEEIPQANIVIVPYSLVVHPNISSQLKAGNPWSVMVIDEVHYCKNPDALRTKALIAPKGSLLSHAVFSWGLSGTLMTNTPDDLWPIFASLGRKHRGNCTTKEKFLRRYCIQAGSWPRLKIVGARRLDELHDKLFKTGFAVMRHKTDVLKDLPTKQYRLMPIEGNGELTVSRNVRLTDADFANANLGMDAGKLAEIRKEIGAVKVGAVSRYIDALLESVDKIIIFAWHQETIEILRDELYFDDIEAVTYYGPMSPRAKEEAKQKFIKDQGTRVFIGNIASAGTGLDGLQSVCSHAVFAECPWTYTEIAQASDRLHRFGQRNPVLIDVLVLTDSIEEYVVRKVLEKEGYFNQTFGTRRKLIRK